MDCQVDRHALIEQYLQGKLQPDLQDDFEVHMLGCEDCQEALELLETARYDLMQRAHVIRASTGARRIRFRWQWAVMTFAALALVAGGLVRWNKPSKSQTLVVASPQTQSPPANSPPVLSSAAPSGGSIQKHESSPELAKTPLNSNRNERTKIPALTDHPMQPAHKLPEDHSANAGPDVLASVPENPVAPFSGSAPAPDASNVSVADVVAVEIFKLSTVKAPPPTYAKIKHPTAAFKLSERIKGYQQLEAMARAERWVFQDAMAAYNKGHYEQASRLLDDAVHIEPEAPDVNFYVGICRLLQGHPTDSLHPLHKAFDKPDSPITQAAHFYLAKAYLQMGNLEEAETEFKAASEISGPLQSEGTSSLEQLRSLRAKTGSNP
jgi:TolA-binding protein